MLFSSNVLYTYICVYIKLRKFTRRKCKPNSSIHFDWKKTASFSLFSSLFFYLRYSQLYVFEFRFFFPQILNSKKKQQLKEA